MNSSILNSTTLNGAYLAGMVFLTASANADATVSSAAERLAKAYAVTQAEAQSSASAIRYGFSVGDAFIQTNVLAEGTRFAESNASLEFILDSTATAVRYEYSLADSFVESETTAYPTNTKFVLGDSFSESIAIGSPAYYKGASGVGRVNSFGFNDSALTRDWAVCFVQFDADGIARTNARAIANSWMGQGVDYAESVSTATARHIKAFSGSAETGLDATTDIYRVSTFRIGANVFSDAYAEPSVTRFSDGITYHYAFSNPEIDLDVSLTGVRYAKAISTPDISSESIATATHQVALNSNSLINLEADATADRARKPKGNATIEVGAAATIENKVQYVGSSFADVFMQASGYITPLISFSGQAYTETAITIDANYNFALKSDPNSEVDAFLVVGVIRDTGAFATTDVVATADCEIVLAFYGESKSHVDASAYITTRHYAVGNAVIEAFAIASGRAGENQIASDKRTYYIKAQDAVYEIPAQNTVYEV